MKPNAHADPSGATGPDDVGYWQTARRRLPLSRPLVMGIVNVTPDSFSDGGLHAEPSAAIGHAERLVAEGADIVDIGGESTRPGARRPDDDEEWARVASPLQAALTMGVAVSVDTSSPTVIARALDLGVDIVNDVRALRLPGALRAVARHPGAGVCLMHMQGEPGTMQSDPRYGDVVAEVRDFLRERLRAARDAGIADERIVLDPGYGFGKRAAHNLELLARQTELREIGRPLLVGWSRKSTLGEVTGRDVGQRLAASVAAALMAVERGARIVRVHDVAPTVDAIRVWQAVQGGAQARWKEARR